MWQTEKVPPQERQLHAKTRDRVDLYFDFISPCSYLAWQRVRGVCTRAGAKLVLHPVLFAGLLHRWGHLGPAEIPPKREFMVKDCVRLALAEVSGSHQAEIVDLLWKAGWERGIDLGSDEEIVRELDEAGFDGAALLARTRDARVKDMLRRETEDAIKRGVFGVPTFIVEDELFWGDDRVEDLERYLKGEPEPDSSQVARILERPSGAMRKSQG